MDNEFLTWSDFEIVDYPIKKKMYSLTDDPERGCFDSDEVDEMIEDSQHGRTFDSDKVDEMIEESQEVKK